MIVLFSCYTKIIIAFTQWPQAVNFISQQSFRFLYNLLFGSRNKLSLIV